MSFPDFFADADSGFRDAEVIIYGVPFGRTSSFRKGAEQAPSAIRQASWNFETYDLRTGIDISCLKYHDYGDLDVSKLKSGEMIHQVADFVKTLKKKVPIAIGGEHAITPGILSGFSKDIAVISLDAHLDFREEYEDDRFNHACVIRRILDHIPVGNIAVLGVRSSEKQEKMEADQQHLFYLDRFFIRDHGIDQAIKKTKEYLGDKKVYLTLDMDVIDPAFAPGTCTPEPFGLSPFEVVTCLEAFAPQLCGFDLVEVCPAYDQGITSVLAAKLIRLVLGALSIRA